MRANPKPATSRRAITELAVGEALVSLLDAKGRPSVTERVFVLPPGSQIGPITPTQRQALIEDSLVAGRLRKDGRPRIGLREAEGPDRSAQADDAQRAGRRIRARRAPVPGANAAGGGMLGGLSDVLFGPPARAAATTRAWPKAWQSRPCAPWASVGREIMRGVLGSIMGSKRRWQALRTVLFLKDCHAS